MGFSPERLALQTLVDPKNVTGTVRLKLYKRNALRLRVKAMVEKHTKRKA